MHTGDSFIWWSIEYLQNKRMYPLFLKIWELQLCETEVSNQYVEMNHFCIISFQMKERYFNCKIFFMRQIAFSFWYIFEFKLMKQKVLIKFIRGVLFGSAFQLIPLQSHLLFTNPTKLWWELFAGLWLRSLFFRLFFQK